MVAERGVELDARIEERLVGDLELRLEVLRALRPDQVVADRHDRVVREPPVENDHLLGKLILRLAAGAEVAEDAELERPVAVRQWDERCGRRLLVLEARNSGDDAARRSPSPVAITRNRSPMTDR